MIRIILVCAILSMVYTAPRGHMKISPEGVAAVNLAISTCKTAKYSSADLLNIILAGEYKEDDEFKNITHCLFSVTGYAYEDGTINVNKLVNQFEDPSVVKKASEDCNKNVGDAVENSFHYFKCIQTNAPVLVTL